MITITTTTRMVMVMCNPMSTGTNTRTVTVMSMVSRMVIHTVMVTGKITITTTILRCRTVW